MTVYITFPKVIYEGTKIPVHVTTDDPNVYAVHLIAYGKTIPLARIKSNEYMGYVDIPRGALTFEPRITIYAHVEKTHKVRKPKRRAIPTILKKALSTITSTATVTGPPTTVTVYQTVTEPPTTVTVPGSTVTVRGTVTNPPTTVTITPPGVTILVHEPPVTVTIPGRKVIVPGRTIYEGSPTITVTGPARTFTVTGTPTVVTKYVA